MAGQDLGDHGPVARAIIDGNVYMTLATADGEGRPWATPVFFAHADHRDFFWISSPDALHSRNLAARPEVSLVVFDSTAPVGSGQAVYVSATVDQLAGEDIAAGLAVYPGPPERGARRIAPEEVQGSGPFRLYRARASQHWILCPSETRPCEEHGIALDHRAEVSL
jgi:Pyridoxamine 5'-phosphate oxidase